MGQGLTAEYSGVFHVSKMSLIHVKLNGNLLGELTVPVSDAEIVRKLINGTVEEDKDDKPDTAQLRLLGYLYSNKYVKLVSGGWEVEESETVHRIIAAKTVGSCHRAGWLDSCGGITGLGREAYLSSL